MSELFVAAGLIGAIGFWAGYWFREYRAKKIVMQYQQSLVELIKEAESRVVSIVVQKEGDKYYVYNENTNEFLAQGSTHKEIIDILNTRFPGINFIANKSNLEEVGYNHESI